VPALERRVQARHAIVGEVGLEALAPQELGVQRAQLDDVVDDEQPPRGDGGGRGRLVEGRSHDRASLSDTGRDRHPRKAR